MSQPIVQVRQVEKSFATVKAVDGISFEVRPGEIFALLGPNGAGKSTLVRMLLGLIQPDAGEILYGLEAVPGRPPRPEEVGYLPEDRGLYKDIPILRTVTYFGTLRGMDRRAAERAGREWLDRLGLAERAGHKLETLSKGNQQKVQFIASILHRPRFAVLDEPFSGLDPLNQAFFLDLLRELADGGTTILLSAHQMELVERVADRVLLMARGREVLSGTLQEILRSSPPSRKIWFAVEGEPRLAFLHQHPAVAEAAVEGSELAVVPREGARLSELLDAVEHEHEVLGVRTGRESLHDIYIRALGGEPLPEPEEVSG
jgi:ABC-2 type transport system ATP-binding protein